MLRTSYNFGGKNIARLPHGEKSTKSAMGKTVLFQPTFEIKPKLACHQLNWRVHERDNSVCPGSSDVNFRFI